ncbi:MAG: hypothetical protein A3F42_07700 [Gammaproteobacteria bacterium RIFCSPHIGHO2_12_FULL_37_34]|nr:MAG: hypothetical protein A3F42_07700 [Gammaproteobacteria bacterium RIFCSPHIGHO2_12_FULL_37_34]
MTQRYSKKTIIISVSIAFLVMLFGYRLLQNTITVFTASSGPPPATVSATTVKTIDSQPYISSVVTLQAVNGVDLSTQVPGVVSKIFFESGQMIETGQPIMSMDTSVLAAQLENATSVMNYKKVTFQRYESLYKKGVVSHDQYDSARSDFNQANASVNELKALINQMTIDAPFSGKLGIRQVNLGQYLTPGTVITSLQQVDPIYANFNIPTQNISQITLGQEIEVSVDSYPGKIYTGKITAIDSVINQDTRGINMQGTVSNPQGELTPGMFGEVKVLLPVQKEALVIPQTAVTYTLYGNSVFIIAQQQNKKGKQYLAVNQRYITLGQREGTNIIVKQGLKEGEMVVTSGQLKLQDGMKVVIDNSAGM